MLKNFPDWLDLMTLWLQTHHSGKPAVVFSNPLGGPDIGYAKRVKQMQDRFGEEFVELVNCEFAVLVCATEAEALKILRETPENNPYTLVWNGKALTSHH